jgi:hypothetical protein
MTPRTRSSSTSPRSGKTPEVCDHPAFDRDDTWEWIEIDGERGVRWRRVGTHDIFSNP